MIRSSPARSVTPASVQNMRTVLGPRPRDVQNLQQPGGDLLSQLRQLRDRARGLQLGELVGDLGADAVDGLKVALASAERSSGWPSIVRAARVCALTLNEFSPRSSRSFAIVSSASTAAELKGLTAMRDGKARIPETAPLRPARASHAQGRCRRASARARRSAPHAERRCRALAASRRGAARWAAAGSGRPARDDERAA